MRLFRRRRLPASVRLPLARDERVVAWAGAADDAVAVATNLGLWLPGANGRLGWHEIHKATWSGRVLTVLPAVVAESRDGYDEMVDGSPASVVLLDPDRVPEQVRARVNRSVAYTRHVKVDGGGVRLVARRVPGVDGLRWAVRYDPGTAPAPDAVSGLVADARAGLTSGESVGGSG